MALTRPNYNNINSNVEVLNDPITVLHGGSTSPNVDVGFLINRANGLVSNVALYWNESGNAITTAFTTSTGTTDSNISLTGYANIATGAHTITPSSTINSTSTSTGALVVTGGAGLSGNVNIGGNLTVSNFLGNVFFGPTPTTTYYTQAPLNLTNSLAGGIKTQLNLINTGGGAGAGSGIDFYTYTSVSGSNYPEARILAVDDGNYSSYITFQTKIPGNTGANALAERIKIDSAGNIVIPTTTVSTSTTTGALIVTGGVGITGNLYVGGNLDVAGTTIFRNTETITTIEYVATINATNLYATTIGNVGAALIGATGRFDTSVTTATLNAATIGNSGATLTGTLSTAAQTNITSVGTLTGLVVSGTTNTNTLIASTLNAATIGNTGAVHTGSTLTLTSYANIAGPLVVTNNTAVQAIQVAGTSTKGGAGYHDFLLVTNQGGGTNPNKTFRLNSAGGVEIINSAYTTNIFTLTDDGNITIPGKITVNALYTTTGLFWSGNNSVISTGGGGTTYTSTGAGNITVSGSTLALTATGPGAVTTGGSTAIPVITTDAYGRVSAISTAAVIAPAGTLSGSTLNSGVTASSLTSVGTLTALTVSGTTQVTSSTASTSNVTGALQVTGGVGVGGNIYVGNRHGYVWGANNVSSAYTVFNNTVNSIDTVFG